MIHNVIDADLEHNEVLGDADPLSNDYLQFFTKVIIVMNGCSDVGTARKNLQLLLDTTE